VDTQTIGNKSKANGAVQSVHKDGIKKSKKHGMNMSKPVNPMYDLKSYDELILIANKLDQKLMNDDNLSVDWESFMHHLLSRSQRKDDTDRVYLSDLDKTELIDLIQTARSMIAGTYKDIYLDQHVTFYDLECATTFFSSILDRAKNVSLSSDKEKDHTYHVTCSVPKHDLQSFRIDATDAGGKL